MSSSLVGAELAEDLLDPATGEVLFSAGLVVDEEAARKIEECGISGPGSSTAMEAASYLATAAWIWR